MGKAIMNGAASTVEHLFARASAARREGRAGEALELLQAVIAQQPDHGPALNSLGLLYLQKGDAAPAIACLSRAGEADPAAPPIWLNLSEAYRMAGDAVAEISSLDRALSLDPTLLPALMRKAQALERLGRAAESATLYKSTLSTVTDEAALPPALRQALAHGRELVRRRADSRDAALSASFAQVMAAHPGEDLSRAELYKEHAAGRRRVYHPEPTAGHFPISPRL